MTDSIIDVLNDEDTHLTLCVSAQDIGEEGINEKKPWIGERTDKFLAHNTDLPRNRIQGLFESGLILLNDAPLKKLSHKIQDGDVFELTVPAPEAPTPLPENISLEIVYEDDDVIVINKPVGMVVHPAPGAYSGTLVNALLYHCAGSLSGINGVKRPGIVHRIDKDTSGLLVVAKNDKAHQKLAKQFKNKSLERRYVAAVWGMVPPEGIVTGNIGRHPRDRKRMTVLENSGKPAETHFTRLAGYKRVASLIECQLKTGRTHQIRVHMTHVGHPLMGDKVYGKAPRDIPLVVKEFMDAWPRGRQALHAASLSFVHPSTGDILTFEAPLPRDMRDLITVLESINI